ncbi:lysoplasmalogenase [Orycteropus afer afer]|uniref:Lysoplasmalogenase TMEM86B n=1 Tax=Orycteropus afer afer TaxID=1230840 RepID=A0A8B7B6B2_ORYAF|nr:lysoplasmalogenase [Orycteropus afer afer]
MASAETLSHPRATSPSDQVILTSPEAMRLLRPVPESTGHRCELTCNHVPSPSSPKATSAQAEALHAASGLSLFFLTCTVYFVLWIPDDPPSPLGALVKCLPVLSLAVRLRAVEQAGAAPTLGLRGVVEAEGTRRSGWGPEGFRGTALTGRPLLLAGMAAFAAAHLLYLMVLGLSPLRPATLLPVALACGPYCGLLLPHLPPDMVLPVAAYAILLAAMLWRGLVRGGSAGLGALLFTVSDSVLAWDTFSQPLPNARLVVMTTYYAAQALLALSAIRGPRCKTN